MKTSLLAILMLLFFSFAANAQKLNCKKIRNGVFSIADKAGTTVIERRGSTQIEQMKPSGTKVVFDVEWIDECTYKLKLKKVLYNPKNYEFPENLETTNKIIEIKRDRYLVEVTSNQSNETLKIELMRGK